MTAPQFTSAMDRTCALISDRFRPERKQQDQTLLQGHRVKAMADAGRSSFEDACRLLNIDEMAVGKAYVWIKADNERLNETYHSTSNSLSEADAALLAWFRRSTPSALGQMIFETVSNQ